MEARELRIGNYVIYDNEVKELCLGRDIDDFIIDLSPIPLTEEWFLKFRCDEDESIISYDLDLDIHVCLNQGQALTGILLDNIKYVHQLQNLYFALTGEELTIKN